MFELPKECYVNKFIPKKVFYEKVGVSSGVKEEFVNLIERITWLYKISPDTIGIPKTDKIDEIQIFQIVVKDKKIPLSVIKTITKGVQYKILFLINFNDDFCYVIKVDDNIYTSEWNDDIQFDFSAINLEITYEKIVKAVIKENSNDKRFDEIIKNRDTKIHLEKRITQLRQKIKNEKQFNRKIELNIELNKLQNQMEVLENE